MSTKIQNLNVPFVSNATLSEFTTFKLGGKCKGLFLCKHPDELKLVIQYLAEEKEEFILMGGGSNLLVSDQGINCYVIRYLSELPLIEHESGTIIVSGSTLLDDLVRFAADHGLAGLNYASGIPGTVGGAIVGNAGAWGKQIGDVVKNATLITRDGKVKQASGYNMGFSYRNSFLKRTGDIVLQAVLLVNDVDPQELKAERQKILAERKLKHPNLKVEPCAGSFFRNIEPTSNADKRQATGWFLEQAGGKNLKFGGAYIYPKHANIIVKGDNCRAQDVYELSKLMAELAKEHFNLDLMREVLLVGNFEGKPSDKPIIW